MNTTLEALYGRGAVLATWLDGSATGLSELAHLAIIRLFGEHLTGLPQKVAEDISYILCCPSLAQVKIDCYVDENEVILYVTASLEDEVQPIGFLTWESDLWLSARTDLPPEARLNFLRISPVRQQLGAIYFARLVDRLRSQGFQRITLLAAGMRNGAFNGYYTWATFGFNIELDSKLELAARRDGFDVRSTHDLILDYGEKGLQWWKENGRTSEAVFELSPKSLHSRLFDRYLKLGRVTWI